MSNRVATFSTFIIMKASGSMKSPTWEKVGKGVKVGSRKSPTEAAAKATADAMAKKLAAAEKLDPTARFYVFRTVSAFRAPPQTPPVESKSY